jgi:hypothetical protein
LDPIDDYVRSQLAAPSPTGRREYTNAEFVALLAARPLRFKPGEQWAYTNAFPLRGMVIEPPWAGCFQGT